MHRFGVSEDIASRMQQLRFRFAALQFFLLTMLGTKDIAGPTLHLFSHHTSCSHVHIMALSYCCPLTSFHF